MRAVRLFARRRGRTGAGDREAAPLDRGLVHTAEMIVRRAWLRDLQELRRLAESQLQTAVADGVQAYETLCRAQRHSDFQEVVEAQVAFDAATRRALAKSHTRERIDALTQAESCSLPACRPAGSGDAGGTAKRRRRIAAVVQGLGSGARRLIARIISGSGASGA